MPGRSYTAADLFDRVAGTHASTLSWHTVMPPGSGATNEHEALEIAISNAGEARLFPKCGSKVELGVTLALRSSSEAIQLEIPATLSAYGLAEQVVHAELSDDGLEPWMHAVANAVEPNGKNRFRVRMAFVDGTVSGHFLVADESSTPRTCELARWPAAHPCDQGERLVPDGEPYQDLEPHYLVEAFRQHPATTLTWLDGGTTRLEIDLQSLDVGACVLEQSSLCDDNCDGRARYSVPSRLRLTTGDGRLDLSVPGHISTTGVEGAWAGLEVSTRSPVVVAPDDLHRFDFDGVLPEQRVVVRFSTVQGIDRAVLELWTLDANDGITSSVGEACATGDVGLRSLIAVGDTAATDL